LAVSAHPGEGRGPASANSQRSPTLETDSDWAPAFAGVGPATRP